MATFKQTERMIAASSRSAFIVKAGLDNIAESSREYTRFLEAQNRPVRVSGIRDCVDLAVGGVQRVVDLLATGVRPTAPPSIAAPDLCDFVPRARRSGRTPVEIFGTARSVEVLIPADFIQRLGRHLTAGRIEALALAATSVTLCETCWATGTVDCTEDREGECWASEDPSEDCGCGGAQYLPCPDCSVKYEEDPAADLAALLG